VLDALGLVAQRYGIAQALHADLLDRDAAIVFHTLDV
jgi:hypothetical protein